MNKNSLARLLMARGTFIAVGVIFILWQILPFDMTADRLPWPDFFYCITMACVVRRPEWVPVWAIFLVFFLRDILTMAPPGLFTLAILLGSEIVRLNLQAFRGYHILLEWLWMTAIFILIMLGQQIILRLMLVQTPLFVGQLWLVLLTAFAYPGVVFVLKFAFGIPRPQSGKYDG
ncbi:MAG: hypothetical protein GDA53_11250 [Rhodobacteraceae bacterium]|nr:hypothetical protein [Paracoccaceae bacterium]